MDKFDYTKPTISKSISSLSKYNYIDIEINNIKKNNSKRISSLSKALKKRITSIQKNADAIFKIILTFIINIQKIKNVIYSKI